MRDKLLRLKLDTTQVLRENTDAVYLTEYDAGQILKEISEEIEKVENPFTPHPRAILSHHKAFESCRQKILSLLRSKE